MGNTKPSLVIPVGINSSRLQAKPNDNLNSLFYIGALDWIPNQEGLIWFIDDVWPFVMKKHPLAIFHVAGRNAPKWFSSRVTSRNVLYHGEVDDAYTYMEQAGIMIVPLFSGSGMRVKIIEGMALGKAIVATSVGVEGIDVTDEKDVLIADDAVNFASKIEQLLGDRDLIKKISLNARSCVMEKYDNASISGNLVKFYSENLNK
jgi:glycosyltransferase involved in cell wall biosynthesis